MYAEYLQQFVENILEHGWIICGTIDGEHPGPLVQNGTLSGEQPLTMDGEHPVAVDGGFSFQGGHKCGRGQQKIVFI